VNPRQHVGTIDPKRLRDTEERGHEYGAGRQTKIHRPPEKKRAKDRLRREIEEGC
jgi:hypothetical protein